MPAMLEARMILCAALGIDHAAFLRDGDKPIGAQGAEAIERLAGFAARRATRRAGCAYSGRREFWGLEYLAIGPAVLIRAPIRRLGRGGAGGDGAAP